MKLLREKLAVAEYFYPFAEQNNPKLYSYINSLPQDPDHPGVVHARMTSRDLNTHREMKNLLGWIKKVLVVDFGEWQKGYWNMPPDIECKEMWAVMMDKGDEIVPHAHAPFLFSFSYYVTAPKGSAPLVLTTSGYKIKPEPGKLVIFESRLVHHVPKDKIGNRCLIAGAFGGMTPQYVN